MEGLTWAFNFFEVFNFKALWEAAQDGHARALLLWGQVPIHSAPPTNDMSVDFIIIIFGSDIHFLVGFELISSCLLLR